MKTFKYEAREYVPGVDLNILGKTFDTLEQGHKEAVKAASDLETTIANIPLNEAEDGFKQQLLNEIRNTVDENTVYGNSYAALDNLIAKTGNIASDGRIIGRLRNQAAKKEYDAKVDSMPITEGMKEMYKEENPYYYEEGEIDKRSGRYLPGKLWKPTTTPVRTVSHTDIQSYALQIAAKDAGSSESVSFLDANGNPTSDPKKSEDGTIYKKVGSRWERLSADKLAKAYRFAINSIPGAKESIHQDYKYERWMYDKEVDKARKSGGDITPFVEGFTDKDGNIYTEDQWLNNKINGFTSLAAYNHTYSSVDFGPALANRRAHQAQARAIAEQSRALSKQASNTNFGFGTIVAGIKKVEGNSFAGANNSKSFANAQALNILKTYMPNEFKNKSFNSVSDLIREYGNLLDKNGNIVYRKDGISIHGPNIAINTIAKRFNISPAHKAILVQAFNGYVASNQQISQMIQKAGPEHKNGLLFQANASNEIYTNDNEYGKQIISTLNTFFKYSKEAKWQVGSQILEGVAQKYGTTIQGLIGKGMNITKTEDGNYLVSIDSNHRNLIPKFASTISKVNNEIPGTIGGYLTKEFTSGVASTNYRFVESTNNHLPLRTMDTFPIFIANYYDKGLEASKKAANKIGNATGTVSFNVIDQSSFKSAWWEENGLRLGYTPEQIRAEQQNANDELDLLFAHGAFDASQIEYVDKNNMTTTDLSKNQDAKMLLQAIYSNDEWRKYASRACVVPVGVQAGQPSTYAITVTVPKDLQNDTFAAGKTYRFIVSGGTQEAIDYNPTTNPSILATNAMNISRSMNSTIENFGYSSALGDTRITPVSNGQYSTAMFGNYGTINAGQAEALTTYLYTLNNIKSQYQAGMFTDNRYRAEQLENSLQAISKEIAPIVNKDPYSVELSIINYLNE